MLDEKIAVVTGAGSVTSKPEDMMRNSRQTCTGLLIAVVAAGCGGSDQGRNSAMHQSSAAIAGSQPSDCPGQCLHIVRRRNQHALPVDQAGSKLWCGCHGG